MEHTVDDLRPGIGPVERSVANKYDSRLGCRTCILRHYAYGSAIAVCRGPLNSRRVSATILAEWCGFDNRGEAYYNAK